MSMKRNQLRVMKICRCFKWGVIALDPHRMRLCKYGLTREALRYKIPTNRYRIRRELGSLYKKLNTEDEIFLV